MSPIEREGVLIRRPSGLAHVPEWDAQGLVEPSMASPYRPVPSHWPGSPDQGIWHARRHGCVPILYGIFWAPNHGADAER